MWLRHFYWSDSGRESVQRLRSVWEKAPGVVLPGDADNVAERLGISHADFKEIYRWSPSTMGPSSLVTEAKRADAVLRGDRVAWELGEDLRPQLNNLLVMHCPGSMTIDELDELAGTILSAIERACIDGTNEVP